MKTIALAASLLIGGALAFAAPSWMPDAGPATQMTGNATTGTFLRGDGVWAVPPAGEAFPVGSVYVSVVSTNPATLLGYGTWSAFGAGRALVGIDAQQTEFDAVEETGGEKTHTLTAAEMPVHTHVQDAHGHTQNSHNHTQDAHTHSVTSVGSSASGGTTNLTGSSDVSSTTATAASATATNQAATATNQTTVATNQNAGSGSAHNNLPPYIVVYLWKRTS